MRTKTLTLLLVGGLAVAAVVSATADPDDSPAQWFGFGRHGGTGMGAGHAMGGSHGPMHGAQDGTHDHNGTHAHNATHGHGGHHGDHSGHHGTHAHNGTHGPGGMRSAAYDRKAFLERCTEHTGNATPCQERAERIEACQAAREAGEPTDDCHGPRMHHLAAHRLLHAGDDPEA